VLQPLLLKFVLQQAINRVQENNEGLQMNETHQPLVYADNVNTLSGNINTINKNTALCQRLVGRLVQIKLSTWLCLITRMQDKITF